MKFYENHQYGDYVSITDLTPEIEKSAKVLLQEQINLLIPKNLQHKITFKTIHIKASSMKVKEDNYEQMGLEREDIGKILDIPECWHVSWIYKP